jgi:hypothetical protein
MSGLRILVAFAIVAMISLAGGAQSTDTGPVTFPATTDQNPPKCETVTVLSGPGGKVFFLYGGFFARNGTTYFGTFQGTPGCGNWVNIQFAPKATACSFTLTSYGAPSQTVQVFYGDNNLTPNVYTMLPNTSVPVKLSGLSFGMTISASYFAISGLTITQPPSNNGIVAFDLPSSLPATSDQTKILMSKALWDVGYPSTAQLSPDSQGNPQIRIAGTLFDAITGLPKSGTVYLRVDDPPDTARYRGADAHNGDNSGNAVLSSPSVQANAQGRFETTLTVHSRAAGDNFQVAGSTSESFNCPTVCPRSAVLTLCKRIYVEEQHMFRTGTFLVGGARANGTTFRIENPGPFQNLAAGTSLQLIHADTGNGEGFYSDLVLFKSVQRDANGQWMIEVDSDPLHGGAVVPRDYGTAVAPLPTVPWALAIRDAVGIPGAGTYSADSGILSPLLQSSFVDIKPIATAIAEVPFVESLDTSPTQATSNAGAIFYANRWFENVDIAPGRRARPNVFHRIAARVSDPVPPSRGGWGVELGATWVAGGSNASVIFGGRIDELSVGPVIAPNGAAMGREYQGKNAAIVNSRTTAHETVHFWIHDQRPGTDTQGHCQQVQYDNTLTCLLHRAAGATGLDDPAAHLHYVQLGSSTDSEYMIIRQAVDPVDQN